MDRLCITHLPDDVVSAVDAYIPASPDAHDVWLEIRPAFLNVVTAFAPETAELFKNLRTPLARYLAWCHHQGLPLLDLEVVFDPDVVEAFIKTLPPGRPMRKDYRRHLRKIGRAVTVDAPWPPPAEQEPRTRILPPYSRADLSALFADARHQKTEGRRTAFRTILLLGLGFGANGHDQIHLRGTDVREHARGIVTGEFESPRRTVPAVDTYAFDILELAERVGDGYVLAGERHKNTVANHVRTFDLGRGTPQLSTDRLRTTWAVGHLWLGVPITELKRALGVSTLQPFRGLLEYVEPRSDEEYRSFLSGKFYWDFFA